MTLTDSQRADAARALAEAWRAREPIGPLSASRSEP
jgi:hypothetical protein